LRELIEEQRPLLVPGVHDAMSAKVVEFVGFSSVYCSSLGTALSLLGLPDTGLATATEIVLAARYIADAVSIPLIADAGNGFGDVSNVMRTTHDFIKAGVGAIHLDDQQSPSQ
jgi:2-methylisocitrate lyase-like PEP mutase family enzyme